MSVMSQTTLNLSDSDEPRINIPAGVCALILPGLGHIISGRVSRGIGAMVGVLGLFLLGLLIGGIDAVDSKSGSDRYWFFGQALVGPIAIGVDYAHQNHFKAYDLSTGELRTGNPGEHRVSDGSRFIWQRLTTEQIEAGMGPPNVPGLGRLNEIAMLSCTIAGMLNLIVFLDALIVTPYRRRASTPAAQASESGGAS